MERRGFVRAALAGGAGLGLGRAAPAAAQSAKPGKAADGFA